MEKSRYRADWLERCSRSPGEIWCYGGCNKNKETYTDLKSFQEVEMIWLCGCCSDVNQSEDPGAKGHL